MFRLPPPDDEILKITLVHVSIYNYRRCTPGRDLEEGEWKILERVRRKDCCCKKVKM
jgi:hypothetical protein